MNRPLTAALFGMAMLSPLPAPAETPPAPTTDLFSTSGKLVIFHMFTGPDNMSRVEEIAIDAVTGSYGSGLIDAGADRVKIGYQPDATVLGYHNANHRTLLIGVQGVMVFEIGDGKQYRIGPGNVVLAEDRTGLGHRNRCEAPAGMRQCMMIQINLRDDETGLRPKP